MSLKSLPLKQLLSKVDGQLNYFRKCNLKPKSMQYTNLQINKREKKQLGIYRSQMLIDSKENVTKTECQE